jgi:hypothetical protein
MQFSLIFVGMGTINGKISLVVVTLLTIFNKNLCEILEDVHNTLTGLC